MNLPVELRASLRLTRCAAHLVTAMGMVALVYPFATRTLRDRLMQRWSRHLLVVLGMRLRVTGDHAPGRTLLVANHVSWLDVFVINAVAPASFVCKADVRRWPLIGWLCAKTETIFMERGKRSAVLRTVREMCLRLEAGSTVVVFPEGTTTDGQSVLPFHGALLQSAVATRSAVQPVVIRYEDVAGARCIAPAYYADVSLWQSLKAVARGNQLVARAEFLTPIRSANSGDRVSLANLARRSIAGRLARAGSVAATRHTCTQEQDTFGVPRST